VTPARPRRWVEPIALLAASLLGSAALWGRLWVTSPSTRGICGCGDPSLFQWFLAWPAHAITTGHSLVFSRDLFHPHGVNLLANTSVLGLGVPLAPLTWLGGPVLTQNVALLLAVPFAVVSMDLLLRRVTTSAPTRVVFSLAYGFSPYVVSSLSISHLMTAWVGVLPLMCLGAVDAVALDAPRARRGKVLLCVAIVFQFFISTELLLLSALVALIAGAVAGVDWLVVRRPPDAPARVLRALAAPLGIAAVLLVVPAAYALFGPRSLKGNIWGPGFNPSTGGTSFSDLVRPHAVGGGLIALSGYAGKPLVQMQYLGWGLLVAVAAAVAFRYADRVVRVGAICVGACVVLSLSPYYVSWAPWQWVGRLPILQNVLQFRIAVFALLAGLVVVARAIEGLRPLGHLGLGVTVVVLAAVALPLVAPELPGLPLRTSRIAFPSWWRAAGPATAALESGWPGFLGDEPAFASDERTTGGPATWRIFIESAR